MDGQLQPASNKRSRTSATCQSAGTVEVPGDHRKLDKEMDDYINAERQPSKCCRKGCNNHLIMSCNYTAVMSHSYKVCI